jgi:hypothetical protein
MGSVTLLVPYLCAGGFELNAGAFALGIAGTGGIDDAAT